MKKNEDRVIQRPERPDKLILLFHGVGSHGDNMIALGEFVARLSPDYAVVTVTASEEFDQGIGGRQWFSIDGVDEQNRMQRVSAAMPEFALRIHTYQRMFAMTAQRTILIGFSQGAIMSLHALFYEANIATRVISLSGRMAALPEMPVTPVHGSRFDFIHGALDGVIFPAYANAAMTHLRNIGYAVTMSLVPGAGHEISRDTLNLVATALAD